MNTSLLPSLLALLALAGCAAAAPRPTPQCAPAEALAPDEVVATVGGEPITAATLDQPIAAKLRAIDTEARQKRYELRRAKLDEMLLERLVKAEAAKRGVSEEQFLTTEIEGDLPAPTEEEIQKVFDENAEELPPGATVETLRPQIVEYLNRVKKQERAKALFERMRRDYQVEVKLVEPRTQVEAKGPSRGPADAKVTLVEFSDFECPFCAKGRDVVEQVMAAYPGQIRLVFRQYPLPFHENAAKAAEAALCADEQGKFWPMHDALFANPQALSPDELKQHAQGVGVDEAKFAECLDSGRMAERVKEDVAAGEAAGVDGTPAFFINGVRLTGAQPLEEFKRIIDRELKR